jgi:hypothetical protein
LRIEHRPDVSVSVSRSFRSTVMAMTRRGGLGEVMFG